MPLKNVHSSNPRVSPQSAWSKFAFKTSLLCVENRLLSVFGFQKFLYAKSLEVVFYSEQQAIRPLPPKVRRRMPAFRRDSFSLSPGRPRPDVWPIGLRPLSPPTNQNVPSMARRPGAEASIKGFLSHVGRNGIEVAKSWVFD